MKNTLANKGKVQCRNCIFLVIDSQPFPPYFNGSKNHCGHSHKSRKSIDNISPNSPRKCKQFKERLKRLEEETNDCSPTNLDELFKSEKWGMFWIRKSPKTQDAVESYLNSAGTKIPKTQEDAARDFGITTATIRNSLSKLKKTGFILKTMYPHYDRKKFPKAKCCLCQHGKENPNYISEYNPHYYSCVYICKYICELKNNYLHASAYNMIRYCAGFEPTSSTALIDDINQQIKRAEERIQRTIERLEKQRKKLEDLKNV